VRSLLPPNASALERALEAVGLDLLDIPVPLAELWNPTTIGANLLPWLAWSLSVDSWKSYWTDAVKRNRVRTAIDIARHKGTAKSVRDVVESFGGHVEIREWWQTEPKGIPHTFELILTLSGQDGTEATAQYVDDVIAEVTRTKPVRSHFSFTQGIQLMGRVGVIAVARPMAFARLQLAGAA
jgi:phage tail P2-like protein